MFAATAEPDVPLAEKFFGPVTAHDCAFVDVHEMVDESPFFMSRGDASIESAVGTGVLPPPEEELLPESHVAEVHSVPPDLLSGTQTFLQVCPPFPEEVHCCS
jgi:hypothetical protein